MTDSEFQCPKIYLSAHYCISQYRSPTCGASLSWSSASWNKSQFIKKCIYEIHLSIFISWNSFVYFVFLYNRILLSLLFWLRTVEDVIRMKLMKRLVIFLMPLVCGPHLSVHLSLMFSLLQEAEEIGGACWQVLPNGIAWIPHLVKTITEVVLNGSKSIVVDKKLIEGPNPNERGKFLIPLIFAFQVCFLDFQCYCVSPLLKQG